MGKIRSGLAGFGRLLAYPLSRPAKDIRQSAENVRTAARLAKEGRQRRVAHAKEVAGLLADQTPADKFQQTYDAWGWTEDALAKQLVAARRARIATLGTGVFGFFGVLVLMLTLKGWVLVVVAAMAMAVPVGGLLYALRFAWYEYQIQTRTLIPLREFLSREDLIARLVSAGGGK